MVQRVLMCLAMMAAAAVSAHAETAEARMARRIEKRTGKILVVPVHGEINRVQSAFIRRSLRGIDATQFDAVVFDLDTPGGRLDMMNRISDDILRLKLPTVSYVSHWALSAGAYIAMSADRIYMAPGAQIGAARAMAMGPDGMPIQLPPEVLEKVTSVNRAQFRSLAQRKGYPAAIAEGMTDETLGVRLVSYDGERMYMTDVQVEEIQNDPARKERLTVIEIVSSKGRLITFTATEAVRFDLANAVADSIEHALKIENIENMELTRVQMTTSDRVVAVLTSPQIVGLLILLAFGGVWLEMKMPGFGVPGTIAIIAFLLVFSSQFLVGNAKAFEILLFLVGIALLFVEIFITPGFGVVGGSGIILVLMSLVFAMQPFMVPREPWQVQEFGTNILAVLSGIAGSMVILLMAVWLMPGTSLFRRFELAAELGAATGYGGGAIEEAPNVLGQTGTTITPLRPSGKMQIGEKSYSVVSESEYIAAGRPARVIKIDGPRIVVAPVEPENQKPPDYLA